MTLFPWLIPYAKVLGEFFKFKLSGQDINSQNCFLHETSLCAKVELNWNNVDFQPQIILSLAAFFHQALSIYYSYDDNQ